MRIHRSLLAIVLAGALTFSFAGCGDDGGSSSPLGGGNNVGNRNGNDSSIDGGDLDDLSDLTGLDEVCYGSAYLFAGMLGAFSGDQDFAEAERFLEDAKKKVPSEIRGDFETVAAGLEKYYELLAKYEGDFTKLAADPGAQAAFEELETDDFTEASERVSIWFEENCSGN